MNSHASPNRTPALVVGGMHRSGTSLLASLLTAAGVHMGDDLMGAAPSNPEGHFEDNDFYRLHQRILASNGLSMEGFTCAERIAVPSPCRAEAAALVERRRAEGRPWGWKEPRTVLFLDFWADLIPESRWLFVVRPPWEVVDSLYRRGDLAFQANPRFAADVWVAYNRRILDFVEARPDRTAVVTAARLIADPAGVVRIAADLIGAPLETPPARFREELFVTGEPGHRAALTLGANPEAVAVHRSLLAIAGDDRRQDDDAVDPPAAAAIAEAGLIEWSRARWTVAEQDAVLARLRQEHAALAAERDETIARLQAECAALAAQLDAERGIYESMRRDMTSRIEASSPVRRRAG